MAIEAPLYPVNLVVAGRHCLVVGGGRVAGQKVRGLLDAEALVHVVATEVDDAMQALAERSDAITLDARPYRPADLDGARLVITATNDREVNQAVARDAEAAGLWVNSADDPTNCSFVLPARVRQGPLLITFSTHGTSPAVSTWLRRRFEAEFGPAYATLIEMLSAERIRLQATGRPTEGLDWQGALDSGMLDLIREGHLAEAKERLQACLSSSSD